MSPDDIENEGNASSTEATPPVRTPLYRAMNAPRYERQKRIRDIEDSTGSKLICYVAGPRAPVHRDDILALVDLFHTLPAGGSIDMLVHTSGGDVDAAEKIASMLRKRVGPTARFRVIVPDFAKSAGTLLALASDTLVMSDSSELGPVDPQLNLPDGRGGRQYQPAQSYLDGYEELT